MLRRKERSVAERNALVVRGGWEGHDPINTTNIFILFLESSGFGVRVEDTLEAYADQPLMNEIDLVVQCWTMGEILPGELEWLRVVIEMGIGVAVWYGGVVNSLRLSTDYLLI